MLAATHPPLVSIIIPVRNGFPYIIEAIESVLHQSFDDFELLIINDGSNDGDYEALHRIDSRIVVHHLAGNGVSSARNFGMQSSRGEFIAFLDADDVWFPGKLQAQVNYLQRHCEAGVVFGGFSKWEADQEGTFAPSSSLTTDCSHLTDSEKSRSGWIYTRLLQGLLVGMNTAIIRRHVLESIGVFNISMRQGEDSDFWLKASQVTEMHALDGCVALYRIHSSSAMHIMANENALLRVLNSAILRWDLQGPHDDNLSMDAFKKRMAQIQFDHAYAHFWNGNINIARKYFLSTFRTGYRPLKSALYVIYSYLNTKKIEKNQAIH